MSFLWSIRTFCQTKEPATSQGTSACSAGSAVAIACRIDRSGARVARRELARSLRQEPVDVAALRANQALRRRVRPVQVEEAGDGGVQLTAALEKQLVRTHLALQAPIQHCDGLGFFFTKPAHE